MADDVLDDLYWVKPADFTTTRTRLAAAAKDGGDTEAAKRISGARRPTVAAWVVNRLALGRAGSLRRIADLREQLRAAHAAMDGVRIRELSREQRRLIDELTRSAFDAAELNEPSAAVRDDVTDKLQAAIADPDVAAQLGRLTKAESWSGFGDFGAISESEAGPDDADQELESAKADLAEAERAQTQADGALSERQAEVVAARRRRDEAENAVKKAEGAYEKSRQASLDAAERVKQAKARLDLDT